KSQLGLEVRDGFGVSGFGRCCVGVLRDQKVDDAVVIVGRPHDFASRFFLLGAFLILQVNAKEKSHCSCRRQRCNDSPGERPIRIGLTSTLICQTLTEARLKLRTHGRFRDGGSGRSTERWGELDFGKTLVALHQVTLDIDGSLGRKLVVYKRLKIGSGLQTVHECVLFLLRYASRERGTSGPSSSCSSASVPEEWVNWTSLGLIRPRASA